MRRERFAAALLLITVGVALFVVNLALYPGFSWIRFAPWFMAAYGFGRLARWFSEGA